MSSAASATLVVAVLFSLHGTPDAASMSLEQVILVQTKTPLKAKEPWLSSDTQEFEGNTVHGRSRLRPRRSPGCNIPSPMPNGFVRASRFHPGKLSFYCRRGFKIAGHSRTLECTHGRWEGSLPRCVPAKRRPPIVNSPHLHVFNPCNNNYSGCAHVCNFDGQKEWCSCRSSGYILVAEKGCADKDECVANNFGCSHICVNTPGSARCGCPRGYVLGKGKKRCLDKDECSVGNFGCSHTCVNTLGSAYCACPRGYLLGKDKKTCSGEI